MCRAAQGIETAAVNLGRLDVPEQKEKELQYGIRRVLPLVEIRAPFELDIWELDNVDRGAAIPIWTISPAAKEIAKFEERAVYDGFSEASIRGLIESSEFDPIAVKPEPGSLLDAVAKAVHAAALRRCRRALRSRTRRRALPMVGFGLRAGLSAAQAIAAGDRRSDRPGAVPSRGVVLSQRGGDAELTLGQDISIGYEHHDARKVRLFFSESFTFRVARSGSRRGAETEAAK